jgi:hypothetical protein
MPRVYGGVVDAGREYCVAVASADDSLVSGKKKKAKLLRAGELMAGVNWFAAGWARSIEGRYWRLVSMR